MTGIALLTSRKQYRNNPAMKITRDYLAEYIQTVGGSEFARRLGVHRSTVSNWANGWRRPSPAMARQIQTLTRGRLKARDIRPDIFA